MSTRREPEHHGALQQEGQQEGGEPGHGPPSVPQPAPTAQQISLWPYRLYALSLGGPCRLRAGYGERDGEMVWITEEDRYYLAIRGADPWVRSGYPVQIWLHGRLAATVLPRRRRTRTGLRRP